ncbi:hypothetical protein [Spiroplasma endosymbiont of Nebria brevicollis]|uniref:hypothetical protein n=1 Tax=Spiroplasma endosymbiont of Nebria brevicollis TaxID=3066284 RepID=UPI00313CADBF
MKTKFIWNYGSAALAFVGACGAGATTILLHNNRKVSQTWNLINALCRGIFGPIFELSKPSFLHKVLSEIWKIVCNGSYVITTLDVNKLHTIFSDNSNYDIDEFPNLAALIIFVSSAVAGILSGVVGLTKVLCTTDGSTANKGLENIQKPLDSVCPAAVGGAGLLFDIPGLCFTCTSSKYVYGWWCCRSN